jgi:glycosyltransferase involved in cell wall biosynthesis
MKPKIMIVTPLYYPQTGGASTCYTQLEKYLSKHSEVIILTSYNNYKKIEKHRETSIYRIIPRRNMFFAILITAFLFPLIYLRHRPNLVIAHMGHSLSLPVGIYSRLLDFQLIKDLQGPGALDHPFNVVIGRVKKFFVVDEKTKSMLTSIGVDEGKIKKLPVLTPPVIDVVKKSPKEKTSPGTVKIIFVGTISRSKGVFYLLHAFEQLKDYDKILQLDLVGRQYRKFDMNQFEFSKNKKVTLHGEKGYVETLTMIKNADMLVLPSLGEGLPRVMLEAMELGTPVIVSDVGEISSIIVDGVNGLIIKPLTAVSVKEKIEKLLIDEELRKDISREGKSTMKQYYHENSWQKLSQDILEEVK